MKTQHSSTSKTKSSLDSFHLPVTIVITIDPQLRSPAACIFTRSIACVYGYRLFLSSLFSITWGKYDDINDMAVFFIPPNCQSVTHKDTYDIRWPPIPTYHTHVNVRRVPAFFHSLSLQVQPAACQQPTEIRPKDIVHVMVTEIPPLSSLS